LKRADFDDHLRIVENFKSHLAALATRQIREGETAGAGVLLVLEREVYRFNLDWAVFTPHGEPEPVAPAKGKKAARAPAAAAAGEKCRHDYRDANGLEADTCLLCDAKKSTRGRKRTQIVIQPPGAPSMPHAKTVKVGAIACVNGNEHGPSADPKSPYCIRCGQPVFKVSESDAG
jgi:hypothetical protein